MQEGLSLLDCKSTCQNLIVKVKRLRQHDDASITRRMLCKIWPRLRRPMIEANDRGQQAKAYIKDDGGRPCTTNGSCPTVKRAMAISRWQQLEARSQKCLRQGKCSTKSLQSILQIEPESARVNASAARGLLQEHWATGDRGTRGESEGFKCAAKCQRWGQAQQEVLIDHDGAPPKMNIKGKSVH